ncbi:Methyltransferase type 11 [Beutenbergia cavernae DSM 12333]|uniref:Methyltransferase type 11 n=1 Tax=Beutenbergia cavernae (strain ATCC BAA-8 / DSM 12333 / CCUG 43141 / JCM 11478 / NBRC 16432 / NCIMB 13614 / HKI 0122) TaxID=471853 RepID=C5BVQ5_BEUC1|nr:class I SAM-dependent methyltransferase [Beutenbergia cavernae]ACQ78495.1 Methyltransferase type 11 [Beutenbergia cavernae DSM 12333]
MTFLPIDADPAPDAVARLTIVPVLPDGTFAALVEGDGRVRLVTGDMRPGEDWLLEGTLRLPKEAAGFRRQRVHVVGIDADHLLVWVDGDVRPDLRPPAPAAELGVFAPEELSRRLAAQGDDDGARAVVQVAASRAGDTDEAYFADAMRLLAPAYLAATTAQGGSGFGGDADAWARRRGQIADAVPADGTFLDLGCANGLLMESVAAWTAARGLRVEPYGVDLSPELVELARRRLPHWADRLAVGNALDWTPADGRRFDVVHVLLDCVPRDRRRELVDHGRALVEPGGRLLVSHYIARGGTEPHVGVQLAAMGLAEPDGLAPERGGDVPMLAWYDRPDDGAAPAR